MDNELDPAIIKSTQSLLGKYVKRPPLTEKLLKKPPFRFLHDVITTVLKTTGFFEGLFDEQELVSENVKDRENKITFLNKIIFVVGATTGKSLSVKPSKIVAGQEPEKTNELLQCLAQALDDKLSSTDAVIKYKQGGKTSSDSKPKESTKPTKKSNDSKSLTSKSSEKLTQKRDGGDKSKNEKPAISKTKQKDKGLVKKESPPKKGSTTKTLTKKNSVEKQAQKKSEELVIKENVVQLEHSLESTTTTNIQETTESDDINVMKEPEILEVDTHNEENDQLNTSYTIADNGLNSSTSSQDLMDPENNQNEEKVTLTIKEDKVQNVREDIVHVPDKKTEPMNTDIETPTVKKQLSLDSKTDSIDAVMKSNNKESNINMVRPLSVRPSSSRPGAPRVRDKHDNIVANNDNLIVGKVNIIIENTHQEEEEDSSIILIEQPTEQSGNDQKEHLQLNTNEHGHLVQQILDSQKEFSQITGKTEIEWQFGVHKARETINQEIEQLRFNIQALSRVANPLGKLLDHMQEDVEVMRQELQQWTKTYDDTSRELMKQKMVNEEALFPLHAKLKQLDAEIVEKHDKIDDLKVVIHKNSSKIAKLLASGNVQ